jgi:hypothetical protein
MTLLVVLGFVVIATILAALYLSLRSARGGDRAAAMNAGGGSARGRQARGGSRSERSPSVGGRLRGLAGRDKSDAAPGRRAGRDLDDRPGSRGYGPSRTRDGADRADGNGLVASGAGRGPRSTGPQSPGPQSPGPQSAGPRPPGPRSPRFTPAEPGAAGPGIPNGLASRTANGTGPRRGAGPEFGGDDTDPAFRPGYGRGPAGYDGYDAAADTRVAGPMDPMPGADRYDTGPAPYRGYAGETSGGYRTPGDPDAAPPRRGYGNGAGTGSNGHHTGPNQAQPDSPGGRHPEPPRGGRNAGAARDAATGSHGSGPADRGFDPAAGGPDATERFSARPGGFDADTGPFSPAPDPLAGTDDRGDGGEGSRSGRRRAGRAGKLQRPHLRMHRGRTDYDDDPWPSADESEGVSDEQFWADLSSDKPLATTARTAGGPDQSRHPGDLAGQGSSEPVPADDPAPPRGRRGRRREEEQPSGTEPRPYQQPDSGSRTGSRRRGQGEPIRSEPSAEEDPLTSASFSRHAREASDSRSYRASRESRRPASPDRPESSMADTQALMREQSGPGSPGPGALGTGPRAARGTRRTPSNGERPGPGQSGPYGAPTYPGGTPDPYAAPPRDPYAGSPGGYQPPGRGGSRHASGPAGPVGTPRPSGAPGGPGPGATGGQRRPRPALPGPALPGPRPPAGPGAGTNGANGTNGRRDSTRDPGGTGYRTPPGGPAGPGGPADRPGGRPGYSNGSGPYQPRPSNGTGDYPNGRRRSGRDNGRKPDDGYDDPYGQTDNGRY